MTRLHSSLGKSLIFAVIAAFSSAFNADDAIWSTFWKEHANSMQTDSDG
jgi:hypothetical protein